jgi:hypothetical protein
MPIKEGIKRALLLSLTETDGDCSSELPSEVLLSQKVEFSGFEDRKIF